MGRRTSPAAADPTAAAAAPDDPGILLTGLARAVCTLAARIPGPPATATQILTGQLQLTDSEAGAIVAAAERRPGG
jgi:hypothetical protein